MPERGGDLTLAHYLPMAASILFGRAHRVPHAPCLDTLCARWKRRAVSAWGFLVLYGPGAFGLSVGSHDDHNPHRGPRVRTIYPHLFGDWEVKDLGYLYDRGLLVGAAQRLLALVVLFLDALDRKREMPIIPAAREVHYQDVWGQT